MGPITTNLIFPTARRKLLSGTMPNLFDGADVWAALMSSSFDFSLASGLTSYADAGVFAKVLSTSSVGVTVCKGGDGSGTNPYPVSVSASAGTVTFSSVTNGSTSEGIIVFLSGSPDAGVGLTDPLLAIYLTNSVGSKIEITGNGGDVTVNWNTDGLFGLSCS